MSASTWGGRPHLAGAERAVIGAVMVDNDILASITPELVPEHFSTDLHREAWTAALRLVEAGELATPVSLRRALNDDGGRFGGGLGGELARLVTEAASPNLIGSYAGAIAAAFEDRMVDDLRHDVDRLVSALPAMVTPEMLGAHLVVRCADIWMRTWAPSLSGARLPASREREFADGVAAMVAAVESDRAELQA